MIALQLRRCYHVIFASACVRSLLFSVTVYCFVCSKQFMRSKPWNDSVFMARQVNNGTHSSLSNQWLILSPFQSKFIFVFFSCSCFDAILLFGSLLLAKHNVLQHLVDFSVSRMNNFYCAAFFHTTERARKVVTRSKVLFRTFYRIYFHFRIRVFSLKLKKNR